MRSDEPSGLLVETGMVKNGKGEKNRRQAGLPRGSRPKVGPLVCSFCVVKLCDVVVKVATYEQTES